MSPEPTILEIASYVRRPHNRRWTEACELQSLTQPRSDPTWGAAVEGQTSRPFRKALTRRAISSLPKKRTNVTYPGIERMGPAGKGPPDHRFVAKFTILILPGVYHENVICYPWISLVGLLKETVFIMAVDVTLPAVTLASFVGVNNLSILMPLDVLETQTAAIVGGSATQNIRNIGLANIDIFPSGGPTDGCRQRALELRNCATGIFTQVGVSYYGHGAGRHAVEVHGPSQTDGSLDLAFSQTDPKGQPWYGVLPGLGWGADIHFIDCFVDALVDGNPDDPNDHNTNDGCLLVTNCHEVHVRNSLLRTAGYGSAIAIHADNPATTQQQNQYQVGFVPGWGFPPLVMVLVEGSTLYSPGRDNPRVLRVGRFTKCVLRHSTTDSVSVPADPFSRYELDTDPEVDFGVTEENL